MRFVDNHGHEYTIGDKVVYSLDETNIIGILRRFDSGLLVVHRGDTIFNITHDDDVFLYESYKRDYPEEFI